MNESGSPSQQRRSNGINGKKVVWVLLGLILAIVLAADFVLSPAQEELNAAYATQKKLTACLKSLEEKEGMSNAAKRDHCRWLVMGKKTPTKP